MGNRMAIRALLGGSSLHQCGAHIDLYKFFTVMGRWRGCTHERFAPEIDRVGALPREFSPRTTLIGFVLTQVNPPEKAKALLKYLSSPGRGVVLHSDRRRARPVR